MGHVTHSSFLVMYRKMSIHPNTSHYNECFILRFFPPPFHHPPLRSSSTPRPSASASSPTPPSSSSTSTSSPLASPSPRHHEAVSCFTSLFHGTLVTLLALHAMLSRRGGLAAPNIASPSPTLPCRPEAASYFTSLFHDTLDKLLNHGVELGEEVLQNPHLALAGVGGSADTQLLSAWHNVVGGGFNDDHQSMEGGGGRCSKGSGRF
jgi:hypothetical protein